jgi:hypothetical protein
VARKPNYGFEKRKKEMDRKAKKEAKREDRRQRREDAREVENTSPPAPGAEDVTRPDAAGSAD